MKKMSKRPNPKKIPPGGDIPDWKRAQNEIIEGFGGKRAVNEDRKRFGGKRR